MCCAALLFDLYLYSSVGGIVIIFYSDEDDSNQSDPEKFGLLPAAIKSHRLAVETS